VRPIRFFVDVHQESYEDDVKTANKNLEEALPEGEHTMSPLLLWKELRKIQKFAMKEARIRDGSFL
jgi:hypothetical protein